MAATWPRPVFDLRRIERSGAQVAAVAVFGLLLVAATPFLWHAHRLTLPEQIASAAGVVAMLCLVGWLSERRSNAIASVFSR